MRSTRLSLLLCLLGSALCTMGTATAVASEPFFPKAGSHAYDVSDYLVRLDYEPRHDGRVRATVRVTATALRKLDGAFSLDFVGPRVTRVEVGGRAVDFEREGAKLRIFFPERTIAKGRTFNTMVSYRGQPPKVTDPDGSEEAGTELTTASSRSASRRGRRPGSPATTSPGTRRASCSRLACRRGCGRSPTAARSRSSAAAATPATPGGNAIR